MFNQTPTEANFRNERVSRHEARSRAARHQEQERRRHQSMPPASWRRPASPIPPPPPPVRPDLNGTMWHSHRYNRAPSVNPRRSLSSSRNFHLIPTEANYRGRRVGRSESRRSEARGREHDRRRHLSPLQDMAPGRQGVSKTQKQGPKPVPSSLQDGNMMSIDPRSKRGGSKSARKGGISTRTGRTPLRGDAQSQATDSYRSRSGSRGGRATRSRGQSTRSRRHRSAQSGDVDRDGAWGDDAMNWDQQSYLSMDQTQNLNVIAQLGGRMNVSEYGSSSSLPSLFSGYSWGSRCSSPVPPEDNYYPPTGSNRRPRSRHRRRRQSPSPHRIHQVRDEPTPLPWIGKAPSPISVVLSRGIRTQGGRTCWMPAEFQTTFDGQIYQVTAGELQRFKNKGYMLKPATDPEWLLKGIRFESVDLNHEGNHGPAAKLFAFQEDAHINRPGPTRIGKIEVRKVR